MLMTKDTMLWKQWHKGRLCSADSVMNLNLTIISQKKIGIHTTPNVEEIVKNLSWLIENPKEILEISKNARAYIEDQHDYIKVAKTYVDTWNS